MAPRIRNQILVLAALVGLSASLIPVPALSRDGEDRDVRIFHRTIEFTQNDLGDPDVVGAAVSQFVWSVFGRSAASSSPRIPLSQFTGTVAEQAQRETWVLLVLEVWVGGDGFPAGYYFRYHGRTAAGDLVRGESFLASPDEVGTLRLTRPSGLVRLITDVDNRLIVTPEHLRAPAGR